MRSQVHMRHVWGGEDWEGNGRRGWNVSAFRSVLVGKGKWHLSISGFHVILGKEVVSLRGSGFQMRGKPSWGGVIDWQKGGIYKGRGWVWLPACDPRLAIHLDGEGKAVQRFLLKHGKTDSPPDSCRDQCKGVSCGGQERLGSVLAAAQTRRGVSPTAGWKLLRGSLKIEGDSL